MLQMTSQFSQDKYVLELLKTSKERQADHPGFIVEAGAATPSHVSNSLLFLESGYSLRLIEGDNKFAWAWRNISGDIKLQEAFIPYNQAGWIARSGHSKTCP
jgi:hypothetical protein